MLEPAVDDFFGEESKVLRRSTNAMERLDTSRLLSSLCDCDFLLVSRMNIVMISISAGAVMMMMIDF